jgi:hypothetical protein
MLRDGAPEQPIIAQKPAPSANRLHPPDMSVDSFGGIDRPTPEEMSALTSVS